MTVKSAVRMMSARAITDARKSTSDRSRLARLNATNPASDWQNSPVFYRYASGFIRDNAVSPSELGMSIALNLWARNHSVTSSAMSVRILEDDYDDDLDHYSFGKSLHLLARNIVKSDPGVKRLDQLPPSFLTRVAALGTSGTVDQLYQNLRFLVDRIDRAVNSDSTQIGVDYSLLAHDISNIVHRDGSLDRDVLARWNRHFWRGGGATS